MLFTFSRGSEDGPALCRDGLEMSEWDMTPVLPEGCRSEVEVQPVIIFFFFFPAGLALGPLVEKGTWQVC